MGENPFMWIKIFHALNCAINLYIGVYCTLLARSAAKTLGISFETPAGVTDFRATYGGICLALGVFFGLAVARKVPLESASWMALLFYAGLASTRLYGMIFERPTTSLMLTFFVLEVLFAAVSILALRSR